MPARRERPPARTHPVTGTVAERAESRGDYTFPFFHGKIEGLEKAETLALACQGSHADAELSLPSAQPKEEQSPVATPIISTDHPDFLNPDLGGVELVHYYEWGHCLRHSEDAPGW